MEIAGSCRIRLKQAMSDDLKQAELSVVVPTYNRAELVVQCIRSLKACDVTRLEIIVVDDGSTDDTARVIASESDVMYLRQNNSGPATARNLGIAHSHGRYVAFLDSDDQWLPGAATEIIRFLDANPDVDLVFCEAQMGNPRNGYGSWIEMAGERAFFELPCRHSDKNFRVLERGPFFAQMLVRNAVFIGATIMRREAFELAGGFDRELCGAADWELWLRMASQMTFAFCSEPLAIYLRHDDCMSNDNDHMVHDFYLALKKVGEKCAHLSPDERALLERQRRAHLFGYAYAAYDRGDYQAAKGRFGRVLCEGKARPRAYGYWLATRLPRGLVAAARHARWWLRRDERLRAYIDQHDRTDDKCSVGVNMESEKC